MAITSSTVSAGKARGVKDAMEFWVEVHMDHTDNYTSFITQRMRFVVTSGAILTIDIQHYINGITALGIKPERIDEIKHKIEAIIRSINPG
jgi:hypothetical protein